MKIAVSDNVSECIFRPVRFGALGGTTNFRHSLGHMKLTYAAKKLFDIQRYTTHPERFCDPGVGAYHQFAPAMENVTDRDWTDLIDEMRSIYGQIQSALRRDYPGGTVTLQRRIKLTTDEEESFELHRQLSYAAHVAIAAQKALQDGHPTVDFDTDILTGWCLYDPGAYGKILIEHEFPIEDVFLSARYIEANSGIEADEWLVLNKHPAGLLKIDPRRIVIPEEALSAFVNEARRLTWDQLNGFRTSLSLKNMKLLMSWPGDHRTWQPWYVRKALAIARWEARRKRVK